MLEIIKFIFSSFWVWAGFTLDLIVFIGFIAAALSNIGQRSGNVSKKS